MKKIVNLALVLFLVLLHGCSVPHFYYWSNEQYVPLYNDKNQFSINTAFSTGLMNSCFELQAGGSLSNHLIMAGSFMTGGNDKSENLLKDYSKTSYFEGELGYFRTFGNNIGVFELLGGYGYGSQHHAFTYVEWDGWTWEKYADGNADFTVSKFFIQPDLGFKLKFLEGALSMRFSRLGYTDINSTGVVHHLDELNALKSNEAPWLLEPAVTIRVGPDPIKFTAQIISSHSISSPDLLYRDLYEPFRFVFGIQFNLGKNMRSQSNIQNLTP